MGPVVIDTHGGNFLHNFDMFIILPSQRTEGSSKSESDTPDDDSRKQRKIAAEHWDDVEKEDVDKLPRELMALDCSS